MAQVEEMGPCEEDGILIKIHMSLSVLELTDERLQNKRQKKATLNELLKRAEVWYSTEHTAVDEVTDKWSLTSLGLCPCKRAPF